MSMMRCMAFGGACLRCSYVMLSGPGDLLFLSVCIVLANSCSVIGFVSGWSW